MNGHHPYGESEIGEQGYLYLVYFLEVPLHTVCFVGVKEQLVNDSEGLIMMYDEREDESERKQEHFLFFIVYSTFVFEHLRKLDRQ